MSKTVEDFNERRFIYLLFVQYEFVVDAPMFNIDGLKMFFCIFKY